MGLSLLNIPTVDFRKSLPFYARLLGIDPEEFVKNTSSELEQYYYPVSSDGIDISISHKAQPRATTTPYFSVDELDRSIETLQEAGGEVVMPPRDMVKKPNGEEKDDEYALGRTAVMVDPDGNYVALMELNDEGKEYFREGGYGEEAAGALRERIELARQGA